MRLHAVHFGVCCRVWQIVWHDARVTGTRAGVSVTRDPVTEMHLVLQTPGMQQVVVEDWARLVASAGIAAVLYENDEPLQDAKRLLRFIAQSAERLHIDATRLGVWACSGNVPNALALLEQHHDICCAALCYGFMPNGSSGDDVVRAGSEWGFATPPVSSELRDFPRLPVLVAMAGCDERPGLNASIDRFVRAARQVHLPVTEFTQPEGRHAFDVMDDTDDSRDVIRQIIDFLGAHLLQ